MKYEGGGGGGGEGQFETPEKTTFKRPNLGLIFSGDVREIGVFGFKEIFSKSVFRFIDLLFLCNSLCCFRLQLLRMETFVGMEHSFDRQKIDSCKGSLFLFSTAAATHGNFCPYRTFI